MSYDYIPHAVRGLGLWLTFPNPLSPKVAPPGLEKEGDSGGGVGSPQNALQFTDRS